MSSELEDIKCVWMSSGVVEYKLCDKNFDCENCHFDKVIRNISNDDAFTSMDIEDQLSCDLLSKLIHYFEEQLIDNNVIYLQKSACLKKVFGNKYYIKLVDPVTALLGNDHEVNFSITSDFVWKDDRWLSINSSAGKFTIKAPISFNRITDFPASNSNEKWDNKSWLSMIEVNEDDLEREMLPYSEIKNRMNKTLSRLYSYQKQIHIDNTMYDGGQKANTLSLIIGKKNHLELLKDYI